ncbi:MAG TPA: hypothetical protein VL335_02235, partial [Candidatus Paceibacterota bacterium]|nr:hypothetical protein [Candidatus Paceibacterota bacterium]
MKTVTKLSLILIVVCIVATVIYGLVFVAPPQSTVPVVVQPEPVVCTMEAKQCPDGSYVGRSGPQCEFAACPSPNTTPPSIRPYDSGVHGTVMLGPTCPVMRNPPDPSCADKPYATLVVVFRSSDP